MTRRCVTGTILPHGGLCEDPAVTREESTGVDVADFAAFVDGLDYPVYVVTTTGAGERSGCLVGFTSQVSIDPPRMLVCISDKNHTHRVVGESSWVAVHLLSPDQGDLASLFGEVTGDEQDKFARCDWRPGPAGVPVLEGCPRHLVGRILERHRFGDHTGLLLEPVRVSVADGPVALTLHDVEHLDPGHSA